MFDFCFGSYYIKENTDMHDVDGKLLKNIKNILLIVLLSCAVCVLVYKAQIKWDDDVKVTCTLMSAHKDNGEVVLSKDNPQIIQDYICYIDNLKEFQIEGKTENVTTNDRIRVEILGLDSGETYYNKETELGLLYGSKEKKKTYKLKGLEKTTSGMILRVIITLETESDVRLILTSNTKFGTVMAFNGEPYDKTNIIYSMKYGQVSELGGFYMFICGWIIVTLIFIYCALFIKKWNVKKWFPLAAIMLGMVVQWVIPVYGVPDEPWHMDTAYQISNDILRSDKEPQDETILKRKCDVITAELLANDVETNSYYQEWFNTFKKPEGEELIRVLYVDVGDQVPDVVYYPAAIGITIGRLSGASGMMTYQLARLMSLLVYIILVWMAIRILPFCNSLTGMVALSLIALQQAASASYDSMINGAIILFVSLCLRFAYDKDDNMSAKSVKTVYMVLTFALAVFIMTIKGGVYTPILLLLIIPVVRDCRYILGGKKHMRKYILALAIAGVLIAAFAVFRFYPLFKSVLSGGELNGEEGYTLSYAVKHPLAVVYIYWRTILKNGDTYLRGLFGGILGWHNIKVSWLIIVPLIIGHLLLVHVEDERPLSTRSYRALSVGISFIVIVLVMSALFFCETKRGRATIWGIQGRYFIPIESLLLSSLVSPMIKVDKLQADRIIYVMCIFETFAMIEIVSGII